MSLLQGIHTLIAHAEMYCDHPKGEHEPGYCDYVVISQADLSLLLEEGTP